jgi:hypothetical protein
MFQHEFPDSGITADRDDYYRMFSLGQKMIPIKNSKNFCKYRKER